MQARGWRTVLVLPLALLLATGPTTAAPLTTLVVTAAGGAINHAPMFVGVSRGIFQRYGLDIRITTPATRFEALQQVADGTAQVGDAAPAVIAQVLARGTRLKAVFTAHGDATGKVPTDDLFTIVARSVSGIREGHLEDLRGKKIGLPSGTLFHQYLLYALAARGLDVTSAVTIVSTLQTGLLGALQGGAVDAIVSTEPLTSQILQSTSGAIVVQRGGNFVQYLELRVVSPRYLATHPGTIKRCITAFAEAAQYVRAHPDEATEIVLRQGRGPSPEAVRTAVRLLDTDMRVSKVTVQAVRQGYDFGVTIGTVKQAPAADELFDIRILRQVEREHPEFFRDLPLVPEALRL